MMTASSEHDSEAVGWFSEDAWHDSVEIASRERQQRGEAYVARHRRAADDDAEA